MTTVKHIPVKYTSTGQYRNAVNNMIHKFQAVEQEDGEWVIDKSRDLPKVKYSGTVKLHGTNGSFIQYADGKIYCQSKSRILDITHDNSGFFAAYKDVDLEPLFEQFKEMYREQFGTDAPYPITICGEWAGQGIQKGVAISDVPKFFSIFGVRVGQPDTRESHWLSAREVRGLQDNDKRIFNILQFGEWELEIDFEDPQMVTHKIEELVHKIEAACPAGKFFGVEGIGEGLVWKPVDMDLQGSEFWFKTKGEKHSVSKVKKLVAVDPEVLRNINEFVDYAVTDNRLKQGIDEVGLDQKKIGAYIGWVNKDINKEEQDVLEANGLVMKDVGKKIADKARKFYMNELNKY